MVLMISDGADIFLDVYWSLGCILGEVVEVIAHFKLDCLLLVVLCFLHTL